MEDAIARGKQVIRNLKRGEFDATVMTAQDCKAYLASLENLKPTGVSLESATKEYAAAFAILGGVPVPPATTPSAMTRKSRPRRSRTW